jgi:predicted transcriptional regulator
MSRFQECLQEPGPRAVLLSVKPRFAEQIASGLKRVEFRRSWAAEPVGMMVIYASAPTQRIIALVEVEGVVHAAPAKLWMQSSIRGPGLARAELLSYLDGKEKGYGILLGRVTSAAKPIEPGSVIDAFRAPQSFRYLSVEELRRIGKKFGLSRATK